MTKSISKAMHLSLPSAKCAKWCMALGRCV